ncbi:hypothetical protein FEM48_Zijuj08G0172300 [Ziziphus jujuba var. spinosa]|uniref:Protein CPR-5-like n=1 Tax=Ziziphus jujuba var. spinosa TaxID=714518 RepID=A0A978V0C7_ZIZJJ|nr:hypothetical protein FEM48_Zijuj08G0172300 [Ziziphus jujuba var. spinosa]
MDVSSSPSPERHGSSDCVINDDEPNNDENEEDDAAPAISAVGSSPEYLNPTVQNTSSAPTDENPEKLIGRSKKKMKKRAAKDFSASKSSTSSSSLGSFQRGTRVACKRRNPIVVFGTARRNPVADALSFRLGMSIAAFVLEKKDSPGERMSAEHLTLICASAVRESLANDFGDTFDSFVRNFEKSFGSTLRTLKLINESSVNKGRNHWSQLNLEGSTSDVYHNKGDHICREGCTSSHNIGICRSEAVIQTNGVQNQLNHSEAIEQNELTDSVDLDLDQHRQTNQMICVSPSPLGSIINQSMRGTIEKSVMEQTRSNDLKSFELGLTMRKLKLKETELALNFESNNLERSKLSMGMSKASFKAEKFKTQLEDLRHAELLKKCIDCLVAGLLLMAASLLYATYIYSYRKIAEATSSCIPSPKARVQLLVDPKTNGIFQFRTAHSQVSSSSCEQNALWYLNDYCSCLFASPTVRIIKTDNAGYIYNLALRICLRFRRQTLHRHIGREWVSLAPVLGDSMPGAFLL